VRFQPVPLATSVEAAIDTMRPMAQGRNVTLTPAMSPLRGPVSGDPDRLQQVVWNLLSNAIKFAPEGGHVAVRLTEMGGQARLQVEDDGPGIDPEFLPYVFERFRQRDSTGTRRHGGLGLGLAIVRHLVELHGGRVSASNRTDSPGARFEVWLPLAAAPSEKGGPQDGPAPVGAGNGSAPALAGKHILLVEDDVDSRELIAMFLESCGAEISAVGSATEALESVARRAPDLIVSDIAMPGKSGYELIRELRARPGDRGGRVPALALTAYAAQEDVRKARQAGFDAHMAKPVEMLHLARVLSELAVARPGKGQGTHDGG
jgi:CheY-like chemotaxis protein